MVDDFSTAIEEMQKQVEIDRKQFLSLMRELDELQKYFESKGNPEAALTVIKSHDLIKHLSLFALETCSNSLQTRTYLSALLNAKQESQNETIN